jgi:hypothetical protein
LRCCCQLLLPLLPLLLSSFPFLSSGCLPNVGQVVSDACSAIAVSPGLLWLWPLHGARCTVLAVAPSPEPAPLPPMPPLPPALAPFPVIDLASSDDECDVTHVGAVASHPSPLGGVRDSAALGSPVVARASVAHSLPPTPPSCGVAAHGCWQGPFPTSGDNAHALLGTPNVPSSTSPPGPRPILTSSGDSLWSFDLTGDGPIAPPVRVTTSRTQPSQPLSRAACASPAASDHASKRLRGESSLDAARLSRSRGPSCASNVNAACVHRGRTPNQLGVAGPSPPPVGHCRNSVGASSSTPARVVASAAASPALQGSLMSQLMAALQYGLHEMAGPAPDPSQLLGLLGAGGSAAALALPQPVPPPPVAPGLLAASLVGGTLMGIGKHKSQTYDWVLANDKGYASWAVGEPKVYGKP